VFVEVVFLYFRSAAARASRMFLRKSAAKGVNIATGSNGFCTISLAGFTSESGHVRAGASDGMKSHPVSSQECWQRCGQNSGLSSMEARSICKIVIFALSVWSSERG